MRVLLHGETGHGESRWAGSRPPDDYVAFRACGEVIGFCGGANPQSFIDMVIEKWERMGAKVERMPCGQGADLFYMWHPECQPSQARYPHWTTAQRRLEEQRRET